ncbi:hypothetical protein Ahy_B01g054243 [Arachis hypogaea]|uniref:Myb/SANT-like domain-containing protein n=1 Tax=Arachis hypogaea TaxID=3818 RepID=A0A445ATK0_ARAHY|nr:hypothetical protein Ahy_B01g054243 [Arachis hypogaea]
MGPEAFRQLCQKLRETEATQPSKDNLRWSDDIDEVLLNVLAKEALKCNRHDGSWTTEAYANVVKTLSIAIGPHIPLHFLLI